MTNSNPFFSIILPTFNSHLPFLMELLHDIQRQTCSDYEVCISDDASSQDDVRAFLRHVDHQYDHFHVDLANVNGGIAVNSNRALAMAQGEFLVFCDHDDRMAPNALKTLEDYIQAQPEADIIYSDEEMIDAQGRRHSPRIQPNWNPDMLLSHMYCPHLLCMRRELVKQVGRFDPELDGAQDYDLMLRASEQARHIGHVAKILYAWRHAPGSTAHDASEKLYAFEAGRRALEHALRRRNEDADVLKAPGSVLGIYRVKRKVKSSRFTHIIECRSKHVWAQIKSIRILARDKVCINLVVEKSNLNRIATNDRCADARVIRVADGSNRAHMYNAGARLAETDLLVFSSAYIELLDSDYPNALLEHAQREKIGAVGAKIVYPNGTFYHTGIEQDQEKGWRYPHHGQFQGPGDWNHAICVRNYPAVSWDLMAISRKKWQIVNGFDESLNHHQDIDICLKLSKYQWRQVYTPYAVAVLQGAVKSEDSLHCRHAVELLTNRYGENDHI